MVTKKVRKQTSDVQRSPETISVTVSRTVQVRQFEPVTIAITEVHQMEEGENARTVRGHVYSNISRSVWKMMNDAIDNCQEEAD